MSTIITTIFERIYELTHNGGQSDFASVFKNITTNKEHNEADRAHQNFTNFQLQKSFILKIIKEIDDLAFEIQNNDTILISVKHQKLLRTCFQLVTTFGISVSLIPGVGISLSKRCTTAALLPSLNITDEEKYEILQICTDFFTRSYKVPVLKNIIITFHLSDYLAALIQLSFAPFKKPGTYNNFTMTQDKYDKLNQDKVKYVQIYEHLVDNCFQPILMKELLVLQSVVNPSPPAFIKRVISKEMSQRLLVPGGLLSLIRCFIESYDIDTGFEWKKIEMICKIVAAKHGNDSEDNYLKNISTQLMQILLSNNTHYLATAVACLLCLNDKYPKSEHVKTLVQEIFTAFDFDSLGLKPNLPGTIIMTPQEVEHKLNVLHACVCTTRLDCPLKLLSPNLYLLFLLGIKCTRNEELQIKFKDTLLKCLSNLNKNEVCAAIKMFLFGKRDLKQSHITIDEFDSGLAVKCVASQFQHPKSDAVLYLLNLFKSSSHNGFIQNAFGASLSILIELTGKRQRKTRKEMLLSTEDDLVLVDDLDEHYANILQLLSEMSTSLKVVSSMKSNPEMVLNFIEYFISNSHADGNEECLTVALVLLNTILSNSDRTTDFEKRCSNLIPVLKKMATNDSNFNNILCKEALSLISSEPQQDSETECGRAITDVFDSLLPVRAHGIIKLTKLIEAKDPETISKKHYIFCLFQEQLKDTDSYIYLSAVNGIAALGAHCTEDVLQVLCNEFLQTSEKESFKTNDNENQIAELRMKIGDVLVKVTKSLGEMAIIHKTILLNTMLCACRDGDPLIRTSALSNLAEIALVLHYRIGSIIYEVLLCIWSIIETDKAVECRRAAVMVISSLIKGLGKEALVQLKENLLPIYRSLKSRYGDPNEDSVIRLHAQIALEELNDAVKQFLLPDLKIEKQIFIMDKHEYVFK